MMLPILLERLVKRLLLVRSCMTWASWKNSMDGPCWKIGLHPWVTQFLKKTRNLRGLQSSWRRQETWEACHKDSTGREKVLTEGKCPSTRGWLMQTFNPSRSVISTGCDFEIHRWGQNWGCTHSSKWGWSMRKWWAKVSNEPLHCIVLGPSCPCQDPSKCAKMHRNKRVPSSVGQHRPGQLFVEPRGNAYSEAAELENLTFYTGSGTRGQVFGLLACFSSFACLFCLETFTTMASQRRPSNFSVLVTCLKTKWRDFVLFCHHSSFLSKGLTGTTWLCNWMQLPKNDPFDCSESNGFDLVWSHYPDSSTRLSFCLSCLSSSTTNHFQQ